MKSKQSIAFLLGNLTVGGSETKFVRLANRLAAIGYDMHVIAIGEPYSLRSQISDEVSVVRLDRRSKFSPGLLIRLKNYLSRKNVQTVICVNTYPLVYGWPAVFLLGRRSHKCVASINTSELLSVRDSVFMFFYAFILRRCDKIIFGSINQSKLWMDRYRINPDKAMVLHNGVDTDYFRPSTSFREAMRLKLQVETGTVVIGCVAQLRPEKNHRNLILAFGRVVESVAGNTALVLIGEGPEEASLRKLVSEQGLGDHVRFVGRVEDVRPFLNALDIFVLASTSVEVFSNAMLEAIAVGVPVISSDVGGAAEMINHGEEGYVYPRQSVGDLTKYLLRLASDRDLASRFRQKATERLNREFTIEQMDAEYIRLFDVNAGQVNA